MKKIALPLFGALLLLSSLASNAQKMDCGQLRNGAFYFYPRNSTNQYVTWRNGDEQVEKNLGTGDTTVYRVEWINDCTYSLAYISTNEKWTQDLIDFEKKNKLVCEITDATDAYYIFKSHFDKHPGLTIHNNDTIWRNERKGFVSTKMFEYINNLALLHKQHFTDTSKYAVLYVYRAKKFVGFSATADLWLNDIPLCSLSNNSGFAFKIFKGGEITISGRDKTGPVREQKINIEFGKKYYLKIHFIPKVDTYYAAIGFDLNPKEAELDFETVSYGN